MLRRLKLENFKSWEKADLRLGAITGLFGSNSSGKTSLIQFLLMLKQTKENVDRSLSLDFGGEKSLADLGSFKDAIFAHETKREISWRLAWDLPDRLTISDPERKRSAKLFEGERIAIESSVRQRKNAFFTNRLAYYFSEVAFKLLAKEGKKTEFDLLYERGESATDFRFIRQQGRAWALPGPVKSYAFPDQAKTYFQNSGFLGDFELAYEKLMDRIYYLGPLREYPKREYPWSGSKPHDVGQRGENVIAALLAARSQGEKQNLRHRGQYYSFDEIIAHWLEELGLIQEFQVKKIARNSNLYQVHVRLTKSSPRTLITDVGFGVSQILPVLVLLHYVPEGSIGDLYLPQIWKFGANDFNG
jgi:hypothetical protein